jgi:adenine-specific DNA-methyltransferase
MTAGYQLLEALTNPIASLIEKVIQVQLDQGLAKWSIFHGWGEPVDHGLVSRQAALNLVLRTLICHRLSPAALLGVVPAHLIVEQSNDLLQGLGIRPQPISPLDDLAEQAGIIVDMLAVAQLAAALSGQQTDLIGDFYASSVPQDARRTLGQFWTPLPIAELMTQWVIQTPADCILDPAFGSGIFLLTALQRLMKLGVSPDSALHQIAGTELSPLVFLMGLTNVLLRYQGAQLRLKWGDFLVPKREPLAALRELATYEVGIRQLTLPGLEAVAPTVFSERFDAIVCNPPYTRHHHLPESYKSSWAALMQQEYGIRLSRFSSLFAYFFVQATRMLAPAGRMAFITPAVVFEASYGRRIKAFVRQQLRLRAIITFDESLSVFEGVDTAACITLVEGPQAPVSDQVAHVQIRKWPGVEPVLRAIEQGDSLTEDWGLSRKIDLSDLEPRRKWTLIGRENGRFNNDAFVPLSDIAHIVRGIATGANDFFVLSDSEVEEWSLSRVNLRPVLTKTREAPGYVFNQADFDRLGCEGKKRWLLYLNGPVVPDTPEARYIQHGETRGLHQRSLVKTRSLWYAMEQRDPAPIYFTYLSRKKSRFIYNQAGVLALNVFLCIYPMPVISQDETMIKALLAVFNSLVAKDSLRYIGRTYGGDTIKIEPREMDRLPVLNPLKLMPYERERLAEFFDSLCQADSDHDEKIIRQTIDEVIAAMY